MPVSARSVFLIACVACVAGSLWWQAPAGPVQAIGTLKAPTILKSVETPTRVTSERSLPVAAPVFGPNLAAAPTAGVPRALAAVSDVSEPDLAHVLGTASELAVPTPAPSVPAPPKPPKTAKPPAGPTVNPPHEGMSAEPRPVPARRELRFIARPVPRVPAAIPETSGSTQANTDPVAVQTLAAITAPATAATSVPTHSVAGSAPMPSPIPRAPSPPTNGPEAPQADVSSGEDAEPVRIYSWNSQPRDTPGVQGFLWVRETTPAWKVLAQARAAWEGVPRERRVVLLFIGGQAQREAVQGPLNVLLAEGLNLQRVAEWWDDVLWSLEKNDLGPHRVAVDFESGLTIFHIVHGQPLEERVPRLYEAWDDPRSRALLPDGLRELDPREVDWFHDRPTTQMWNHFAAGFLAGELRRVLTRPLKRVFPEARISNYNDFAHGGDVSDRNGWVIPSVQMGDDTSPVLYSGDATANLRFVEACREHGAGAVVPWIAFPSWRGTREAWEQTVRDAHAAGVREFLFWNVEHERKAIDDDEFAARVFRSLGAGTFRGASYD